jgi:hypothetical protein
MLRLPIDTSGMMFMGALPPEPVTDFDSKAPKTDANGELLYAVQVVALTGDGAEVIKVTVPGEPNVTPGAVLRLDGLVASPWSMGERSGVSFRATRIEPVNASAAKQPAKAE